MEVLALIPLLIILSYISYKDWKEKKIKNEHILFLFGIGIILRFFDGVLFHFPNFLVVFLYGSFIAVLFWLVGIWPAGDAKLMIALLLFLPGNMYNDLNSIFNFLANTFVPIFFFTVIILFWRSKSKRIKEAVKFTLDPYRVSLLILVLLGFVGLIQKVLRFLGLQVDYFITILILFIAFEFVLAYLTFQMEIFMLALAAFRLFLDFWNIFTYQYLSYLFSLIGVFLFFRFFILYLAYYAYTKEIKLENLEPKMSLAEGIKRGKEGLGKVKLLSFSLVDFFMQRRKDFIHSLNYLDEEEVKKLKEMKEKGEIGIESIRIHQKQPFAVFLSLGFLITYLIGTNFINLINKVFLGG